MVEGGSQRVDVGADVGMPCIPSVLLQGRILHRATPLEDGYGSGVIRDQELNQAKVYQLDGAGRSKFDIGRFNVPVQDRRVLAGKGFPNLTQVIGPG